MMPSTEQRPWSVLRQFVRPRPPAERCELCGASIAPEHSHLLEPSTRQLHCACTACSICLSGLQDARYQRVPPRADSLDDFRMSEEIWEDFHLPINLAFFLHNSAAGRVQAYFPSPAGATESLLTLESWDRLVSENLVLRTLQPDVEALLVNRLNGSNATYLVSVDECYKLVGLIRAYWHGFSGGAAVWGQIVAYFEGLEARSRPSGGTPHARVEL
ncbi:DUF5947 family protein [Isosphaeraceae bacterium EP7]